MEIQTEDGKIMNINQNITNFSGLFNTLHENYDTKGCTPLSGIFEKDLNILIDFCEACDYTIIKFDVPLWKKPFKNHYDEIIKGKQKSEKFYNELTCEKLMECIKISDFYESNPLKVFYILNYMMFSMTNKNVKNISKIKIKKLWKEY